MRAEIIEGLRDISALAEPWRRLEQRSLEPNAFVSPRFVLPVLNCLAPPAPPWAVAVWSDGGRDALVGLGVFHRCGPHGRFPLPHAQACGGVHAYLGGLLLDLDQAAPALGALLDTAASRSAGLHLRDLAWDGATAELLRSTARARGLSWHEQGRYDRACLDLGSEGGTSRWRAHLPTTRLREAARLRRRLVARGRLGWRWLKGQEVGDATLERFLELEHAGWKGREGTSLRADPAHEAFFLQMAQGFRRDGELFFTELLLDGQPIASSCNLRSGDRGFAFKVAFDPEHARSGPGILNELGLLEALESDMDGLRHLDSGTQAGSFIEGLWPDRVTLVTGTLALRPVAEAAARAATAWSRLRGRLQSATALTAMTA